MNKITEENRRRGALIMAHGGWWGAVGLLVVNISMGGAKPAGDAPPWLGLIIVVLIGVGIAGGAALSRMRLTRAILGAFEQGYRLNKDGTHYPRIGDRDKE